MDEARLREQLLGCGLVVRLRVRREVRVDPDSPPIAMTRTGMDGQTLELQEDLHVMLGELGAQKLAAMDVRRAVVDALHVDVAVGVELDLFPLANVERYRRQRFQGHSLDGIEAFAARDAKARVRPRVDALYAFTQRPIDLRERGEALAPMAKTHVAHEDLHQSFDDRLVLRMPGTCRDHGRAVVAGELGVTGVEIRIVEMAFEDALLEAVRYGDVRHAAVEGEHPSVTGEPVAALRVFGGPGE